MAGCATTDETVASGPKSTCYVCKYNNDLACVVVHVKETTPHVELDGKTYWFCSESCRDEFLKHPQKYLPKTSEPPQAQ
jgi:YHS domain-containing protein